MPPGHFAPDAAHAARLAAEQGGQAAGGPCTHRCHCAQARRHAPSRARARLNAARSLAAGLHPHGEERADRSEPAHPHPAHVQALRGADGARPARPHHARVRPCDVCAALACACVRVHAPRLDAYANGCVHRCSFCTSSKSEQSTGPTRCSRSSRTRLRRTCPQAREGGCGWGAGVKGWVAECASVCVCLCVVCVCSRSRPSCAQIRHVQDREARQSSRMGQAAAEGPRCPLSWGDRARSHAILSVYVERALSLFSLVCVCISLSVFVSLSVCLSLSFLFSLSLSLSLLLCLLVSSLPPSLPPSLSLSLSLSHFLFPRCPLLHAMC